MAHLVTHLHQLKELQRHVPQYIPVHVISLQDLANINTGTQVFNGKDCTMVENGVTKQNPNCTPGSSASGPVITTHSTDVSTSGTSTSSNSASGSTTITSSSSVSTSTSTGSGTLDCPKGINAETGECNGAMFIKAASAMLVACYAAMY